MTETLEQSLRIDKRNRRIITVGFVIAAVFFFGGGWLIQSKLAAPRQRMNERKQLAMYGVDHNIVRDACRYVREHRSEFRPDSALNIYQPGYVNPDASDPKMPAVIRDMAPTYVLAGAEEVRIEMGDDIYHFGLSFSDQPTKYSMQPVVANLWFYTQDGVVPDRLR